MAPYDVYQTPPPPPTAEESCGKSKHFNPIFVDPRGLIQANHFIYSNHSSLDGCKIVVQGSLIHSVS